MSYRDSNGYFYTNNSYPIAHITKEKYEAQQRKDLPRTIKTFEKIQIGNEPYYMDTQFGYVSLDYKGTLTHVGSKLEATIFKDFAGSGAGKVHIEITNGQYADCIVSTYANGVMMAKNTKETKAEFQFTKQDNALVLTASSESTNVGNKMALKKDTGFFYANNVYEIALIVKVLYNPAVDEPKNLPK